MNAVEVTSGQKYTGPYTIKINGQEIVDVMDIDLNGLLKGDEARHITISILVNEFSVKTEK